MLVILTAEQWVTQTVAFMSGSCEETFQVLLNLKVLHLIQWYMLKSFINQNIG